MNILQRLWNSVKVYGYPSAYGSEVSGMGRSPARRRRGKANGQQAFLEVMENRILLTAIFKGETFTYTNSNGKPVTVNLNDTAPVAVSAEMIAAIQSSNGSLAFGNIAGAFGSGNTKFNVGNTDVVTTTTPGQPAATAGQSALIGVSSDADGNIYGFRISYATNPAGTARLTVPNTQPAVPQVLGIQLEVYDNQGNLTATYDLSGASGAWPGLSALSIGVSAAAIDPTIGTANSNGQVLGTLYFDAQIASSGATLNFAEPTAAAGQGQGWSLTGPAPAVGDVMTQASSGASGTWTGNGFEIQETTGQFDSSGPITDTTNGQSFLTLNGVDPFASTTPPGVLKQRTVLPTASSDGLWAIDLGTLTPDTNGSAAPVKDARCNQFDSSVAVGVNYSVTALAFNVTSTTTADLWGWHEFRAGTNGNGLTAPNGAVFSSFFEIDSNGAYSTVTNTPPQPVPGLLETYGPTQVLADNVTGIAFIPGDGNTNGNGATFLYANMNSGTMIRMDVGANSPNFGVVTVWSNTIDQDPGQGNAKTGANPGGMTFNAGITDPFTGTLGAFMMVDQTTGQLAFLDKRMWIAKGDIYAVYSNQADINATMTFRGANLYTGTYAFTPVTTPTTVGDAYIGALGVLTPGNNVANGAAGGWLSNNPFISGGLDGAISILPELLAPTGTTPDRTLFSGLFVGYSMEQPVVDANGNVITLGSGFENVLGAAITRDGQMWTINSSSTGGDQLAQVDDDPSSGTYGTIIGGPVQITGITVDGLTGANQATFEGMAFGDPDFTGTDQLFAVYDLHDGNGPTLGIIDTDSTSPTFGQWTSLGQSLGLGNLAKVQGISFGLGGSTQDPNHQALYIVADLNGADADATGDATFSNPSGQQESTLFQVDTDSTSGTYGQVFDIAGIGQVVNTNGNSVVVNSMTTDDSGNLIIHDVLSGSIMDIDPTTAVTGNVVATDTGSVNPTVGAIAMDLDSLTMFAIDNAVPDDNSAARVGFTTGGGAVDTVVGSNFSHLVQISLNANGNDDVNFGKMMVDGTITGKVFVSGSMETLYGGWIITGGTPYNTSAPTLPQYWIGMDGQSSATQNLDFTNNISFGGDIRNIMSINSIGSDGKEGANALLISTYTTGTQVFAGGKIGQIKTLGAFYGTAVAENSTVAPIITDADLPQRDQEVWVLQGETANGLWDAGLGVVVPTVATAPGFGFGNTDFNHPQYIGSIRNAANDGDVIDVTGNLDLSTTGTAPDPFDYYGVALLAGQQVTVQAIQTGVGLISFGIIDPDGRLIATDASDVDPAQVNNQPITFTADRPGVYRIVVATGGSYGMNTPATPQTAINNLPLPTVPGIPGRGQDTYELTVANAGNMAIGAVAAQGHIVDQGGIWADFGDIGAVVADSANTAATTPNSTGFALYGFSADFDLQVSHGNLRDVQAGTLGLLQGQLANHGGAFTAEPHVNVPEGQIGLVQTTMPVSTGTIPSGILALETTDALTGAITPAGGNIQLLDSAWEIGGLFYTNQGFSVIRAGQMSLGSAQTVFQANADNVGNDGIIDLIDVTNDLGTPLTLQTDGPAIRTGIGGNVRFMQVGGGIVQDVNFGGGVTSLPNGYISNSPGVPVTLTDDSGAIIFMQATPQNTDPVGVNTGQLQVRAYGIEGTGGVVILNVNSTTGVNIAVNSGGVRRQAEVSSIEVNDTGVNLAGKPIIFDPVTGVPEIQTTSLAADLSVNITSANNTRIDVFNISTPESAAAGTEPFIDNIFNNTGGDVVNTSVNDVGNFMVTGNIGSTNSIVPGMLVNPIAPPPIPLGSTNTSFIAHLPVTTYPFVDQRVFVITRAVGNLWAGKSLGNVEARDFQSTNLGVLGSVAANSDHVDDPNTFEGITGPIVALGSTTIPGSTSTFTTGIFSVNIGEGIAPSGTGAMSRAGIYATNSINLVTGTNADIRGNIDSSTHIGTIALNNGSIVDANIVVVLSFNMSSEFIPPVTAVTADNIDNPIFEISAITINGNGGIIGMFMLANNIGNIVVGPQGFGILNCVISTINDGVINEIIAGGYGIRDVTQIGSATVHVISATGSGAVIPISNFEPSLRQSEKFTTDLQEWQPISRLTDLDDFLLGNGAVNGGGPVLEPLPDGVSPAGPNLTVPLTSGVITRSSFQGQRNLDSLSAYEIIQSSFQFASATGPVTVRDFINNMTILSGKLASLTVAHDILDPDIEVAGPIGPVTVGGNFLNDGLGTSLIEAKGPNGDVTSVTVKGDFQGNLVVSGRLLTISIGTAGVGTAPSTGDLSGNITVQGNHPASVAVSSFKVWGDVTGGSIDITGDVGTMDFAHSLLGLSTDLTITGNLSNLLVGTDPHKNGDTLGSPVTVGGNLTNVTVTGAATSSLVVRGNLGTETINSDPATVGTNIDSGSTFSGGTIGAVTINGGSLSGTVDAAKTLSSVRIINGSLTATGQVTSSLGDISSLVITTGNLNGTVTTPNGQIASLVLSGTGVNGNIGATAVIKGKSIPSLNIPGSIAGGASINMGSIGSINVTGSIGAGVNIHAGSMTSLHTGQDMLGNVAIDFNGASTSMTIGRDLGGSSSFGNQVSVTVSRNLLAGSTLSVNNNLTNLTVTGGLNGDVLVDGAITNLSAGTMTNAVITSGFGISSFRVTGIMTNSLVTAGLTRGADGIFGTGDLGEQPRMADIVSVSVGALTNSIITAGGNIGTFHATGLVTNSSVSSGLVLGGAQIAAVMADPTPLANAGELNAARMNTTLFHGNFTSATAGTAAAAYVNSVLTAGVSPGADGIFGTADDNVNTSLTGGRSAFTTRTGFMDATSLVLADTAGAGATTIGYTTDGTAATSITAGNPLNPAQLVGTATPNNPFTVTVGANTLKVTVTGVGASVAIYDDPSTPSVVDALLISGTGINPVTVSVVTSAPGTLDLGRVLSTDDSVVSSFTFNGDIKGDGIANTPDVWIDSPMTTFSFRNMPNDPTWSGQIGGAVTTLTMNQQGPGQFRIGGTVSSLNVTTSIGNPLYTPVAGQTLTPASGSVTLLAVNPITGHKYAFAGGKIYDVTNANSSASTTQAFFNTPITLTGMASNSSGQLFAVADVNTYEPVSTIGTNTLSGLDLTTAAVNSVGNIFTIDSSSGNDELVQIDPTSGVSTVIGTLVDPFGHTFSGDVLTMAFNPFNGLLEAIVDNRAGATGPASTGDAIVKIALTANGAGNVLVSNPTSNGSAGILLNAGGIFNDFDAMAITAGNAIWVSRVVAGHDELDKIVISGTGSTATAVLSGANGGLGSGTSAIEINGNFTSLVGMSFANNQLVGLNDDAFGQSIIGISTATPNASIQVSEPDALSNNLIGYVINSSGTAFGFNDTQLFDSPAAGATLGQIDPVTGVFTELQPLVQDLVGTPLANPVVSLAINSSGEAFVVTDHDELLAFNTLDGSLLSLPPSGTIRDTATGRTLNITQITVDNNDNLIGLDGDLGEFFTINPTQQSSGGVNFYNASAISEPGIGSTTDITGFAFNGNTNQFEGFSQTVGGIVDLNLNQSSLGGVIATSFGNIAVKMNGSGFNGRMYASGVLTGNSVTSVSITGAGTFAGHVVTPGSIGSVTETGSDFGGSLVAGMNLGPVTITTGNVTAAGLIDAGMTLNGFTNTGGTFSGSLLAGRATTVTLASMASGAVINIIKDSSSVAINGADSGHVTVGPTSSFRVTGLYGATANTLINGDTSSVSLSGGTSLGSLLLVTGGISGGLVVGGTDLGVISVRRNVGSASFGNLSQAVVALGGDVGSISVIGTTTNSIVSSGVWIGLDGVYNTADDVIYGGSIGVARFGGLFTDSVVAAGALPRIGAATGSPFANNIPLDNRFFAGNPNAPAVQDVDSVEAGGIVLSKIGTMSFGKPVVSSFPTTGQESVAIAADGIGTSNLLPSTQLVKYVPINPIGAPFLAPGINGAQVNFLSSTQLTIAFSQPLDTASINSNTIKVLDINGQPLQGLQYGYTTQTAADGSIQGLVTITDTQGRFVQSATPVPQQVVIVGGPTFWVVDHTGLRSAVYDFAQSGTPNLASNPFGSTVVATNAAF